MKQLNLLAAALIAVSCSKDKLDFGMAKDIRLQPEVEAPLINAKLSLADLEERDSNIVVDPDNALRIKYVRDSVFFISASDFVKIPEQNPVTLPMSQGASQFDSDIQLGTLGGVILDQATLNSGHFVIKLQTQSPILSDVSVKVQIKNALINGVPMSKTVTLPAASFEATDSVDLSSAVFDFTGGQQKINYIGLSLEVLNPSALAGGSTVNVVTQFKRLGIDEANGYFGQRNIQIPANSLDFDISGLDDLVDGFYLTDPQLILTTTSTLGASLAMKLDLDGVNKGGTVVSLNAGSQAINAADDPNTPKQNIIKFDKSNSNIADFFANIPSEILYSGKVELNPSGTTNNFISSKSGVKAGVEINVPLSLRADNIKLDKVLNDIDFFRENPDEIESLALIFYTDNGFPFDVSLDVKFLQINTGDSIHGFSLPLLNAAPVDATGKVIAHSPGERLEVEFTADMLERIKQVDKLQIIGHISTANGGSQTATLYTDYELGVKIAARVKLNVKL